MKCPPGLQLCHNTYRWFIELQDLNLAIHADLLDGSQSLGCDHVDLQACVLGYDQVQVIGGSEVTWRRSEIIIIIIIITVTMEFYMYIGCPPKNRNAQFSLL